MIHHIDRDHEQEPHLAPAANDHIAPAPRISVQAYCEAEHTAAVVCSASQ